MSTSNLAGLPPKVRQHIDKLQWEAKVLRQQNERLKKRVEKLEVALSVDIKEVAGALLRGVDRLAQAQQIVVSALENARDIIKTAAS